MRRLKAVLIDLNGTLHIGNELIGGSANALKK
jgi:ribonucleotide monophosphatase NagD (HAD superfamily)